MDQQTNEPLNPSKIMQVGMGFWASKVMLAAVKFNLFTCSRVLQKAGQKLRKSCSLAQPAGMFMTGWICWSPWVF